VVAHIEERLSELDAEKDELKEYQKLDKQRRAWSTPSSRRSCTSARRSWRG